MSTWEEQRADGYRSARMLRTVIRGLFYTACALVLPAALALASAWAGPS